MLIKLKSIFRVCSASAVAGLAACATHPLPDDISRETTTSIIRNIRCEAKDEVRRQVAAILSRSRSATVRAMAPESVIANLSAIKASDPPIANTINRYSGIAIAYTFRFDITENDNDSASASFNLPFTANKAPKDRGNFSFGVSGGLSQQRQAKREINMVENFKDLATLDCSQASEPHANIVYPITGSIGMAEIIRTFLRLGESGAGGTKAPGADAQYNDHVTFTTFLKEQAKPTLAITPVGNGLQLVNASGTFGADRKDIHEMQVALVFPKTGASNSFEDAKIRAAENLCVQRALAREDDAGIVRLSAPERYCIGDFNRFTR